MNLLPRVEYAIENAMLLESFDETYVPDKTYLNAPDDTPIHINPGSPREAPNQVAIPAGPDAITQLMTTFETVSGLSLDPNYIAENQQHEYQHVLAAQRLGATTIKMGIHVYRIEQAGTAGLLGVQPFAACIDFKTTKLADALKAGFPVKPSDDDMKKVLSYGYSSIGELAERVMRHNRDRKDPATELFYPIPLGYSTVSQPTRLHHAHVVHLN